MRILIKHWRRKRRLTLKDVSILSGYSISYLSEIENNKKNPTLNILAILANVLEVCPRLLIKCDVNIFCCKCSYYKRGSRRQAK